MKFFGSPMLEKHISAMESMVGRSVEAGWFESARYPSSAETKNKKEAEANLAEAKKAGAKGKQLEVHKKLVATATSAARTGRSIAANARTQEFGATIRRGDTTITIPARPFMRLAWSQFSQKRSAIQAKVAINMINGGLSVEQGLGQIGLALEGEIIRAIKNGNWTPNAKSTADAKGFNKPLIDSALMWQTVSSKVT